MAILTIRDADGKIQEVLAIRGKDGINGVDGKDGIDGKDYVLTAEDKQEIASMISGGGGGEMPDMSDYALKSDVLTLKVVTDAEINNFDSPEELIKSVLYWRHDAYEEIESSYAFVFSFGSNWIYSQVAVTEEGKVYKRTEIDNFAEWHCVADESYCNKTVFNNFVARYEAVEETRDETIQDHESRIGDLESSGGGNYVEQVEYNSTDGSLQGRVYIVDKNNAQTSRELRITGAYDSIPVRNANGNFYVNTPTIQYECTNKKYVDDAIAALRAEFTSGDEVSY